MKKLLISTLLLIAPAIKPNDATGQTYYTIRSEFQSARPERISLWRYDAAQENENGRHGSFEVVPFGGQSTRPKDLAGYFMFGGKNELVFAGDNAFGAGVLPTNPNLRDVNAFYFGLPDTFISTVTFRPRHAIVGGGLLWRQYLGNFCKTHWWFELSTVVENIRNDMNLKETILSPVPVPSDPTAPSSVAQAFAGQQFTSGTGTTGFDKGKIIGKKSTTKLGDFELKLGGDTCICQTGHIEGYVGVIAPVGNRPDATYVFAPAVGSGHFGVEIGSAFGVDLWCCNETTVRFELEQNSRYLLANTQERSCDVNGKPWSRYQLVTTSLAALGAPVSGINDIFTKKMDVTPRFAHTLNAAVVSRGCRWESEAGYNLWARQSEKVKLKYAWTDTPAFVSPTLSVNRAVTIGENFTGADVAVTTQDQYNELSIKASDLNLNSAAHPEAFSQTLYAAFGYHLDGCCYPTLFGFGASYEFSGVNTALNQWMVWGKIGISL